MKSVGFCSSVGKILVSIHGGSKLDKISTVKEDAKHDICRDKIRIKTSGRTFEIGASCAEYFWLMTCFFVHI